MSKSQSRYKNKRQLSLLYNWLETICKFYVMCYMKLIYISTPLKFRVAHSERLG